jgi:hypothetical protein
MREIRWDVWLGRTQKINGSDSFDESWVFDDNCVAAGLFGRLSVLRWLTANLLIVSLILVFLLFLYGLGISNGTNRLRTDIHLMCYGLDCLCGTSFTCRRRAFISIMKIQFEDLVTCVVVLTSQLKCLPKDILSV